jgi:dolichyl-phosphate beta-glucosyltransferase
MSRDLTLLSVVIPAFNEERRLGATLERACAWLGSQAFAWEVVVVDDGSSDGTSALVKRFAATEPRVRLVRVGTNRGKGNAVREGFFAATGRLVLFSDADLSTPIEEFDRLRRALDAGAQVAMGSRALAESEVRVRQNVIRQTMGKTFNLLVRMVSGLPFADTQCGFKLFLRDESAPIFRAQRLDGFAFDVELLFLARRVGLVIAEVPVAWVNSADSRVRIVRDSSRMLRDLFRIRLNAFAGRYDEALRGAAKETRGAIGVIAKDGAYLLIERAQGVTHPGAWCFPGGHVEDGETSSQAIVRELREELGIEVEPVALVGTVSIDRYRLDVWTVKHVSGDLRAHEPEIASMRFLTTDEIRAISLAMPSNARVLELLGHAT